MPTFYARIFTSDEGLGGFIEPHGEPLTQAQASAAAGTMITDAVITYPPEPESGPWEGDISNAVLEYTNPELGGDYAQKEPDYWEGIREIAAIVYDPEFHVFKDSLIIEYTAAQECGFGSGSNPQVTCHDFGSRVRLTFYSLGTYLSLSALRVWWDGHGTPTPSAFWTSRIGASEIT